MQPVARGARVVRAQGRAPSPGEARGMSGAFLAGKRPGLTFEGQETVKIRATVLQVKETVSARECK